MTTEAMTTVDDARECASQAKAEILKVVALLHSVANVDEVVLTYRHGLTDQNTHRETLLIMAMDCLKNACDALEPIS